MSTRALTKSATVPSLFDDFFKPCNEWFDDTRFFNRVATIPSVNITENSNYYNVALAAPGLKNDDFKIDVDGNMLTISSEKKKKRKKKMKNTPVRSTASLLSPGASHCPKM